MTTSKITSTIGWLLVPFALLLWPRYKDGNYNTLIEPLSALPAPSAGLVKPEPKTTDGRVYAKFPRDALSFVSPGMPPSSNYLLGRNYLWNGMYSPRWQQTSGKALRMMLAAGRAVDARRAFLAIKAGSDAITSGGKLPFLLPSTLQGYVVTATVEAQAGSFFLGESCLAIKAFSQYPTSLTSSVATAAELSAVTAALGRGLAWLEALDSKLFAADSNSANRLMFDAVTYQACGSLIDDRVAIDLVDAYVAKATSLFNSQGYFIEKSGWDTHYQAVAINQGNDLLLAGYDGAYAPLLKDDLRLAADWLLARVDSNGVVHSAGNTRICWSGETILGGEKMLDPRETWRAMAYSGLINDDSAMQNAAPLVAAWLRSKPTTTCVY